MFIIVTQRLRDVCRFDTCLEWIEIFLRIGDVVEIEDVTVRFGVSDFDADSAT